MGLDLINRLIFPLVKKGIIFLSSKSVEKCKECKGEMVNTVSYLYLIPVMIDKEHEESAQYYIQNAVKIDDTEQIPKGNRACYMHIFQCQNCGNKIVSVVDFLKVREQEVIKGGDMYPYAPFRDFFDMQD